MESARRVRDRNFKNVFKGSVLVTTLMDHDKNRFENRDGAIKFAQRLLDAGHIESVVGSHSFEDSVHLYRWSDETVVREAKRMVSTTSSHIPRKKLIELVDLHQGDSGDDGHTVVDTKEKLKAQVEKNNNNVVAERPHMLSAAERARRRERRRKTLDAAQIAESSQPVVNVPSSHRRHREDSNLKRHTSVSTDALDDNTHKVTNSNNNNSEPAGSGQEIKDGTQRHRVYRSNCSSPTTSVSERESREVNRCSSVPLPESQELRVISPDITQESDVTSPAPDDPDGTTTNNPDDSIATCRYDGVEMAAIDLENVDFDALRPTPASPVVPSSPYSSSRTTVTSPQTVTSPLTVASTAAEVAAVQQSLRQSLEDLTQESYSYSDNEKQLLEQMKRMQTQHETVVVSYKEQIEEMNRKVSELRELAELLQQSDSNKVKLTAAANQAQQDMNSSMTKDHELSSVGEPPAPPLSPTGLVPPPPAPPPPPPPNMNLQKVVKPNKPAIKPRVKMRPLFWNRILLDHSKPSVEDDDDKNDPTFWHVATEPNFNVDDFEKLFGKSLESENSRSKSLHDAMTSNKAKGRMQTAKILEDNRSRAVAIKLRSMHCQMDDIKAAVYNMDYSKIELDSLNSLYEVRGTKEELDKIMEHIQAHEDVPLDQPEQFLVELSEMSHFPERMECMMFTKRFNETLFNVDQQLSSIETACEDLRQCPSLWVVMEMILAFGNYMNGATQRGQADGFDLSILSKLKDVKSMANNLSLLQYIVRVHTTEHEEDAGREDALYRMPETQPLLQAAQVSFSEVDAELNRLQYQLVTHKKKAELVCLATPSELLQPFKDQLDDFFESADDMLTAQQDKLAEIRLCFQGFLRYLCVKDVTEQVTPEAFFTIWIEFLDDYKHAWKMEQKRIAKKMFEKVEQKRKERMRQAKRRKSVVEDGKSNLKHKFAEMRKRGENVSGQNFRMLRSHSVNAIENPDNVASGESDRPPRSAPPHEADHPRRRRRVPPDSYDNSRSVENSGYTSDASERGGRTESMAERMQRRRRSRGINMVDLQNNVVNNKNVMRQDAPHQRLPHPEVRVRSMSVDHSADMHQFDGRAGRRRRSQPGSDDLPLTVQNDVKYDGVPTSSNHRRRLEGISHPPGSQTETTDEHQRGFYRPRTREHVESITELAKHKLPRDRSPLPTSPPLYPNYARQKFNKSESIDELTRVSGPPLSQRGSTSVSPHGSHRDLSTPSSLRSSSPELPQRPSHPVGYSQRQRYRSASHMAPETETRSHDDRSDTDANYRDALRKLSRKHHAPPSANAVYEQYGRQDHPHGPMRVQYGPGGSNC